MPCGSLQVVSDGIVVFEAEIVADDLRDDGRDAAELCVAECVARAGLSQEFAVPVSSTLTDYDDAVVVFVHAFFYTAEEGALVERYLGKQDNVRRLRGSIAGETARGRDPAGMPTHDLKNENLG